MTVLQSHVVRWIAYAGKLPEKSLHMSVVYRVLNELDHQWASWSTEPLSREEEDALAESFIAFVDYCLSCLRKIRYLFGPRQSNSSKLEYLLKYTSFFPSFPFASSTFLIFLDDSFIDLLPPLPMFVRPPFCFVTRSGVGCFYRIQST